MITRTLIAVLACCVHVACPPLAAQVTAKEIPTETVQSMPHLIGVMSEELDYSMKHLVTEDGTKPYYLEYTVNDVSQLAIGASLGALSRKNESRRRVLEAIVRVGNHELDNTHAIRGGMGRGGFRFSGASAISTEDVEKAIKHALWKSTDAAFKAAVQRYQQVVTNLKTKVREEDDSDDFSREEPSVHIGELTRLEIDSASWEERLRRVSAVARKHPLIYDSSAALSASAENRYMVTSEGTRLQTGRKLMRVVVSAATRAEDGMALSQSEILDARTEEGLPSEAAIAEAFERVVHKVLALREAPMVEPTTCPAILRNRASAVFFHEIFGHRIEGHRQKDVEEGQTFTKKIGKPVLPEFMSVRDDPTLARFDGVDLRGHYHFDDEGVPASEARLIEDGVLKGFLLNRSPIAGFPRSNGHGRRQPGRPSVSRQANLIVSSSKSVGYEDLRQLMVEECKKQGKPYGLVFEDITGGFTTTRRQGAQSFKVLPVVVYQVFADGRPDQLVRGVDIVGTPLSCFSRITHTADDPAVFNGTCGAESGSVPVSAISPSILVSQIEVELRQRAQEKPPILPPPIAEEKQ